MSTSALQFGEHKRVIALAWPMIISNVSIPLLGIVDTAILGHLDSAVYLGAVAIGASIMAFIFWGFGFLRMGTTAMTAQAVGRKDVDTTVQTLVHSRVLALLLGSLLIVLSNPLLVLALNLVSPSPKLWSLASDYCQIRIWGSPGVLFSMVVIGWFIGQQNTRIPLVIMVTTNVVNIALDALLIIGLDMNSDGAAIATVCADYLGAGLAGYFIWSQYRQRLKTRMIKQLLVLKQYQQLFTINGYLFLRTQIMLLVFAFFTAQGAQMGDDILAANAIILQLLLLVSYGLDGFAHACEALIGQAVGAKKPQRFTAVLTVTGFWCFVISLLLSVIFWAFEWPIIHLFTSISDVQEQLQHYYQWLLILPVLSVSAYWLDGVFIGSGAGRDMFLSMFVAAAVGFFPCWYLSQHLNNHGLWLSFTLFNVFRGLGLALLLKPLCNRLAL